VFFIGGDWRVNENFTLFCSFVFPLPVANKNTPIVPKYEVLIHRHKIATAIHAGMTILYSHDRPVQ